MRSGIRRNLLAMALGVTGIITIGTLNVARAEDNHTLQGRIVAVGIPGASAITPVGTFHGPIPNTPALAVFIQPGKVLDPARILVGSSSNFEAPLARTDQLPGSFLSIDPNGDTLAIDPNFASAGGQASTLGGRVQVFTANNAAFLNSIKNPIAKTADFTGASNPLGISLNNAFGRLWPANAPNGLEGEGTSTILDPQGWGLAGAPNLNFGGVYAGDLTNRGTVGTIVSGVLLTDHQITAGALNYGAVGTALLGHSPDGGGKAVFAVVEADGSIVQEHTLQGLDGLMPRGTISPLIGQHDGFDSVGNAGLSPRLGVVFKWETESNGLPPEILYVTEPFQNRIAALVLTVKVKVTNDADSGKIFQASDPTYLTSDALNEPIDLTPVQMETTDLGFASNTTLDADSDFYVANRGNNTIVRMTQTGVVVAVRKVARADGKGLGEGRLNGIATSPDGSKIWVTVTGRLPGFPNSTGAVLELPSF